MDLLTTIMIKGLIIYYSKTYGADPAFCMAVATVESRIGNQEFRVGRLGRSRFFGPFGINQCFLKRWAIDDWRENVRRGVLALRGGDKKTILRRYNREFNSAYYGAVMAAEKRYREELGCR